MDLRRHKQSLKGIETREKEWNMSATIISGIYSHNKKFKNQTKITKQKTNKKTSRMFTNQ